MNLIWIYFSVFIFTPVFLILLGRSIYHRVILPRINIYMLSIYIYIEYFQQPTMGQRIKNLAIINISHVNTAFLFPMITCFFKHRDFLLLFFSVNMLYCSIQWYNLVHNTADNILYTYTGWQVSGLCWARFFVYPPLGTRWLITYVNNCGIWDGTETILLKQPVRW